MSKAKLGLMIVSLLATIGGLAVDAAKGYVEDKKMDEKIDKKIEEALADRENEESEEESCESEEES